jgi:beta-galactosidase
MKPFRLTSLLPVLAAGLLSARSGSAAEPNAAVLPDGVRAVWDTDKAYRETTPSRERICLNGLWRWQPGESMPDAVPAGGWGWFKVPGCWPGITDYMQKDAQTLVRHPDWKQTNLSRMTTAWYEREAAIPANWKGRRVSLALEYLNSSFSGAAGQCRSQRGNGHL